MAANYPLERLGARLGFSVRDGAIHDPTPPLGAPETPGYAFAPSSAWTPQRVTVIGREDPRLARLAELARDNPSWILVIEGAHMGLSLPSADWEALADPRGALDALDRVYRAEVELVGGRGPYGGAKIWLTPLDAPNAPWWMHSGNPIVFQAAAARAEILPRLAAEGHPGWGVAHELGHNLHGSSCGDLFVPTHTTEVWPNVFALWSYHRNGWSPTAQMGPDLFAKGHAHHAAANPSFEAIKADPFVLLGALELIWRRYGWEGFGRFFTAAAIAVEGGAAAGDDAARLAWWVEHLSEAYAVDFAPAIAHWGFPVTPATAAATRRFPPADLD
jgi:hypothetical protein